MAIFKIGDNLKLLVVSKLTGVPMDTLKGVWAFLNGKKTYVGAAITVVAFLASGVGVVLPVFGFSAVAVAKVAGYFTLALGLLHKAYKLVYGEDVPPANN